MSQIFPYGITLKENGKVALFPAAEVIFHRKEGESLSLLLVIDSGATISALPKGDAHVLKVDVQKGLSITIYGIDGTSLRGWRHELPVKLGHEELIIPVAFLDHEEAPRILGREGIFDRFLILFNESRRRTALINKGSTEAQAIEKIIDILR